MLKQDRFSYVELMQHLGNIKTENSQKVYRCGSPPAMLSRNYYVRKVPHVPNEDVPVLFMDNIVTHDKRDQRIILSEHLKLHNGESCFHSKCVKNKQDTQLYLFEVLQTIENRTADWYEFCVEIIKWAAFISKRNMEIEEWTKCNLKEKVEVLNFLTSISETEIAIDVIECPLCKKFHMGSFSICNDMVSVPCGKFTMFELAAKGAFRLKKGFLQFVPVLLKKGNVLVRKDFYESNLEIIKKWNWEDKFLVIDSLEQKEEYIFDSLTKSIPGYSKFRIFVGMNDAKNWDIVTAAFGRNACLLIVLRHILKISGNYRVADELRIKAAQLYYMKIDDLGDGRYAVSEVMR